MPTVPTHALVATALFVSFRSRRWNRWLWVAGMFCAMLPDIDVIGFSFGVRYGDLLGHRGLSHSLTFAGIVAAFIAAVRFPRHAFTAWCFLFACTASHGLLDAATDGGLGVAFWSPFSNERYFWPWRPIRVSPIGLMRFSLPRMRDVIATELMWIWLPCVLVMIAAYRFRDRRRNRRTRI